MLMSAPALKNFSPAPRMTITWTLESNRAFTIASSNCFKLSSVYALAGGLLNSIIATPS